jgi:hypothetical protein
VVVVGGTLQFFQSMLLSQTDTLASLYITIANAVTLAHGRSLVVTQ